MVNLTVQNKILGYSFDIYMYLCIFTVIVVTENKQKTVDNYQTISFEGCH